MPTTNGSAMSTTPNEELTEAISYSFSPSALLSRLRSVPHAVVPALVADHIHDFLGPHHLRVVGALEEDLAKSVRTFFWRPEMGPIDKVTRGIPNVTRLSARDFGAEKFDEENDTDNEEETDDRRVVAALATIPNVTSLIFTGGRTISAKTCAAAAVLPRLTTLDFRRCSKVNNVALKEFSKSKTFPVLSRLVLAHTDSRIRVENAAALAALPALTDLNLDGHNVDNRVVTALSKSSMLERLDIAYSKRLDDDGMRALSRLATLKHIRLSGARLVTDDGVVALVTRCVRLSSLDIADMEQLTDTTVLAICASLAELEVLTMSSGTASARTLPSFERLSKLTELDLGHQAQLAGGGALPALCAAAPQLKTLRWPSDDCMHTSDFGAIKTLRHLTSISVSITFTPQHFAVIGEHPSLTDVSASHCRGVTAEGLAELRKNKRLRRLLVSNSDMDDEGVVVVKAMSNVEKFHYYCCPQVSK